jgi:O-methyltransferase
MSEPDRAAGDADATAPGTRDTRSHDPEQWIHRPIEKYRKGKRLYPHRPSPAFFALADPVVQSRRTLLGYDRLYVLWQAVQNVQTLQGAVAEVGTYRGGSAYFIASAFAAVTGQEASFLVFDTFAGHPAEAITEQDPFHVPGQFDGTSYDDVKAYLSPYAQLRMHAGDVLKVLPTMHETPYRLVHLDTDLYAPTRACLDYFGQRMPPGGVFVLDDYASANCPGVRAALAEFLERNEAYQVWDLRTEQLMLVKC